VVGDYVTGLTRVHGSNLRVAQAVAASAAVPGVLALMKLRGLEFPCEDRGRPRLVDGGSHDNTGLEALTGDRYRDVFLISINSGGVFVTRKIHGPPIIRDLARADSLLYRQSTGLRTRWMVERFQAWEAFRSRYPELRTFDGKDLAFVPTVFNQLEPGLLQALVYRGWWLTGAVLAELHPDIQGLDGDVRPPDTA
jgi:NTE family protein